MADEQLKNTRNIVCLGGGIGTVNLLRGLKVYTKNITTIISMADDGGSAGRLRRLYNTLPVGDLISCMAAMSNGTGIAAKTLSYRFQGARYGKDDTLGGHKLGNLIIVALKDITGSYEEAIKVCKTLFSVDGTFLPATDSYVDISAQTIEGKEIFGEEKIDLGKYRGKRILEKVFLHPKDTPAGKGVVSAIKHAQTIICGPGDLYTNLLPVLIIPDVAAALKETKAKKIFVINVANKPFETRGYEVVDYIKAVTRHIDTFPFDTIIVNDNTSVHIPDKYKYKYVPFKEKVEKTITVVTKDIVDQAFPLYHDPHKLAKAIIETI